MVTIVKKVKRNLSGSARRRRIAPFVGTIFIVFALIGVFSVGMVCFNSIMELFDNSDEVERFEGFISPVVMMDPAPFTSVENLEDDMLLQSSLWAALTGENRGAYTYDENGLLLVPSSDVDVAAAKLYGPSVHIIHRSFDDTDASYLFDPEISAYRVPSVNKVAYSPAITNMQKVGESIVLTVGYVAPGNIWTTEPIDDSESNEPTPEKYMLYSLAKWEQGYYISSVDYVDAAAAPMS